MKCERCNENEATIIAIKISNGKPQEVHICEKCAHESDGTGFAIPMSFQDFFQGILDIISMESQYDYYDEDSEDNETAETTCNVCGMTYSEFKNTGRLGCENCYRTFKQLDTILKNMQGNNRHSGKIPNRGRSELVTKREIDNLKNQLAVAIKMEEYEDAAKIRDRIRAIEKGE